MGRRKRGEKVDGWVIIDKPEGVTSTQVVGKVRRSTNAQKVGHGGTLDPLASGILPIGLGEGTKTMPFIVDASKDYEFTVLFGHETSTDDREGEVTASGGHVPTEAALEAVLPAFLGTIDQVPPAYSAIKVDGQRAYDLARAGEVVTLKSRPVEIHALRLVGFDADAGTADFAVTCGKGTYVRSLGRDIARKLGTFGTITALRRTRVGPFGLGQAISLEKWETFCHGPPAVAEVLSVMTALDDIPALAVSEEQTARIRQGQSLEWPGEDGAAARVPAGTVVLMLGDTTEPVAIAEAVHQNGGVSVKPQRVFNL